MTKSKPLCTRYVSLLCLALFIFAYCFCHETRAHDKRETSPEVKSAMAIWEEVSKKNDNEAKAVSEFINSYSKHAQYLPDIERKFLNVLFKTGIGNRFAIRNVPVSGWESSTAVTVWQPRGPSTPLRAGSEDFYIFLPDRFGEDELRHGAIYRFKGKVVLSGSGFDGYLFNGDRDDPVTFGCICDGVGFVYLHGTGTVKTPDGKIVCLPPSSNIATAQVDRVDDLTRDRFRLEPSKTNAGFFKIPGQPFEAEAGLGTEIVFNGDSFAGLSPFPKGTKLVIEEDGTLSVNREGLVVSDKTGKKWVSCTVNFSGKRTIVFLPERTASAAKIIRGTVIDCGRQAMAEPEPGSKVAKAVTLAEMAQQAKPFILLKTHKGVQTRYICTDKSIEEVGYVAQGDVVECIISEDGKIVTKIRKIQTAYSKETVLVLQKKLTELGYNPGPIDGIWGKKTKTALEKFQRDNGLPVSGQLDSKTKETLGTEDVVSRIKEPSREEYKPVSSKELSFSIVGMDEDEITWTGKMSDKIVDANFKELICEGHKIEVEVTRIEKGWIRTKLYGKIRVTFAAVPIDMGWNKTVYLTYSQKKKFLELKKK